jgi:hypothetical protein
VQNAAATGELDSALGSGPSLTPRVRDFVLIIPMRAQSSVAPRTHLHKAALKSHSRPLETYPSLSLGFAERSSGGVQGLHLRSDECSE